MDFTLVNALFDQVQYVLELLGVWSLLQATIGLILVVGATTSIIKWVRS